MGVEGFLDGSRKVDGFSMVEAALAAGQGEKGIDELCLILADVDNLLAGGSKRIEGDVWISQSYLEERLAEHEGSAQFMGGVGNEASLGVEGILEAGEKPIDGVAEVFELVVGARECETLVEVVLGDITSGGGHDPERS